MKKLIFLLAVIILIAACKSKNSSTPIKPIVDIDGNGYDTVKIGTQFWIKQNLKTAHYRNGDLIPNVTDSIAWAALTTGAWCWYKNDSATYDATYGKLYNWYAVNDPRGLAPTGYHIPSGAEWTTLSTSLGGDMDCGYKMKETGTTHWTAPNTGATNSSGFTGLPGGARDLNGSYYYDNVNNTGFWWSSTEKSSSDAWLRTLYYDDGSFLTVGTYKQPGYSVRCLRD